MVACSTCRYWNRYDGNSKCSYCSAKSIINGKEVEVQEGNFFNGPCYWEERDDMVEKRLSDKGW